MTKNELKLVLTEIGVRPSRRLGQNFLIDANLAEALLRPAALKPQDRVLEVGPGTGMLTRRLLNAGCKVSAIEFDWRLAAYLRTQFAGNENFRLFEADACQADLAEIMGTEPYVCIANLPYAISSVLLSRFLEQNNPPQAMYLLLQREVGERLAAAPSCREYGSLSVRLGLMYRIKIIRRVPATVFFPAPAVDSVQLQLLLREERPELRLRQQVARIVNLGFAQRRKKLMSLLVNGEVASADHCQKRFSELGLNHDARAENLSPEQFLTLAQALNE